MNRQGSSGIEWTDWTWNPVTGCLKNCSYCFARRIGERFDGHFKPTLHVDRLVEPMRVKKPSKIFVVSMGDLFGEWVPEGWILDVFEGIERAPQHTYMFLTRNPTRYASFPFSDNCWLGATIEKSSKANLATPLLLPVFAHSPGSHPKTFISLEPLLGSIEGLDFSGIDLLIVGAMTGPGAIKPKKEWLESVIATGHPNILWKRNVRPFLKEYGLVV